MFWEPQGLHHLLHRSYRGVTLRILFKMSQSSVMTATDFLLLAFTTVTFKPCVRCAGCEMPRWYQLCLSDLPSHSPSSPLLTNSILASHSLLQASSTIKAWCFSHFLCSFWASSRAVPRAISIFSSCSSSSLAKGDKNSHHQEPTAWTSPSPPFCPQDVLDVRATRTEMVEGYLCSHHPPQLPPVSLFRKKALEQQQQQQQWWKRSVLLLVASGSLCPPDSWVLRY